MTNKRGLSRIAVQTPVNTTDAVPKGYVDGRGQVLLDDDGVPYYAPGTATPPADLSMQWAGVNLAYARRASQFNWSGAAEAWFDVENCEIKIATLYGPAYIEVIGGILVATNGATPIAFQCRIFNSSTNEEVVIGYTVLPAGAAGSINANGVCGLKALLPVGLPEYRYVFQIRAMTAVSSPYLAPSWLQKGVCDIFATGC